MYTLGREIICFDVNRSTITISTFSFSVTLTFDLLTFAPLQLRVSRSHLHLIWSFYGCLMSSRRQTDRQTDRQGSTLNAASSSWWPHDKTRWFCRRVNFTGITEHCLVMLVCVVISLNWLYLASKIIRLNCTNVLVAPRALLSSVKG